MQNNSNIIDIFKIKFEHIDRECESKCRSKIADYSYIKFENGHHRIPDLQKVANILTSVVFCKEEMFNKEIARIFAVAGGIRSFSELERIQNVVATYFEEARYLNRFEMCVESIKRDISRRGLHSNLQDDQIKIAASMFEASVKTFTRRAKSSVQTELSIYLINKDLEAPRDLPGINDIIDFKPNIYGIGINFNKFIEWFNSKFR